MQLKNNNKFQIAVRERYLSHIETHIITNIFCQNADSVDAIYICKRRTCTERMHGKRTESLVRSHCDRLGRFNFGYHIVCELPAHRAHKEHTQSAHRAHIERTSEPTGGAYGRSESAQKKSKELTESY